MQSNGLSDSVDAHESIEPQEQYQRNLVQIFLDDARIVQKDI